MTRHGWSRGLSGADSAAGLKKRGEIGTVV